MSFFLLPSLFYQLVVSYPSGICGPGETPSNACAAIRSAKLLLSPFFQKEIFFTSKWFSYKISLTFSKHQLFVSKSSWLNAESTHIYIKIFDISCRSSSLVIPRSSKSLYRPCSEIGTLPSIVGVYKKVLPSAV